MTLSDFVNRKRKSLFDALSEGQKPPEGEYDEALFRDGRDKGKPQMGATRYEPRSVSLEFIYPIADGAPLVLSVTVPTPERVVFMPIPDWVVESVWEGDVSGTYRLESEARSLLDDFEKLLDPGANEALFGPKNPIGRH